MKAILIDENSPNKQLYIGETARPTPKPTELLVRVKCTALNRADLVQRKGQYPPPPGASTIIGLEASGIVEEVGADVPASFAVGTPVCVLLAGGGYAQYVAVDWRSAIRIPTKKDSNEPILTFEQAAAIPEVFLTAFQTLFHIAQIHTTGAQVVLIHAGASGVGLAAIQLAKSLGLKYIITTSSEEKCKSCEAMGATLALNYRAEQDWSQRVLEHTNGQGVDVILDSIGAPYFDKNVKSLRADGSIVYIAFQGGSSLENVDLRALFAKRASLNFSTLRARSVEYKGTLVREFLEFVGENLEKFQNGSLRPVIDSVYDWQHVEEAHNRMGSNANIGKIVLRVAQ